MATQAGAKKTPASKITEEERLRRIAEAAYHRAQARGFAGGNPDEDWLAVEAEIDASLKGTKKKTAKGATDKPKSATPKTADAKVAKPKVAKSKTAKATTAKGKGGK